MRKEPAQPGAITKPLDLACLGAFKKEMEGQAVAPDVERLDALPAGIKEKVEALLDSLHLCGGCLRLRVGSARALQALRGGREST